jgi:acyl-CoA dehydrogenase
MIQLELTEQQRQLREMAHYVAESLLRPAALEADRTEQVPEEVLRTLVQMGIGGFTPKSLGGDDHGPKDKAGIGQGNRLTVIGSEELSWGDAGIMMNVPGPGLGGPPVRFLGTPEQIKRYFGMLKGDDLKWGAYGLTEPGAGSDVASISTTCRKEGSRWVLKGTKCYITNGARASWTAIFATVDKRLGRAGHRVFVVEKGTPGFRVGKIEEKMGLRASETAELVLDDCELPEEALLGGEERYQGKEGFMGAMQTFNSSRPMVAAMALGIARASYERCRDFIRDNYQLGRPIARYRVITDRLARMAQRIDAARLMIWHASYLADAGIPNAKEASMSKAYAAEVALEVTEGALQLCGAAGLVHDQFLELWYRNIKVFDIFEGTGQIQRVIISKRIIDGIREF